MEEKYKDLEVRASVYKVSRCYALCISSKAIAKNIKNKKVSVERENNIFKIYPDTNGRPMWNYKKQDIVRIPVTRLLTEEEKLSIRKSPLYTKAIFDKNFLFGNLSQHEIATFNPLYEKNDIPNNILWVNCILNGSKNRGYTILLTRKALYRLAKTKEIRVLFQRIQKGILLRLTADRRKGRKLYPAASSRKAYSVEIAFPKELKSYLNGKIGIPLEEFGLHSYDFSENEYEKQLIMALEEKGIEVYPGSSQTMGDVFFVNHKGFIEITTFSPSRIRDTRLRHSSASLQIRGRIFEAEHMAIHRNIKPNFIVVNELWKNNKYILEEAKEAEKHNVFVIFTDFKNNWADVVVEKIVSFGG